MNYLEWNNLITKHFFNPENTGKEVLLYVTKELIEELGGSQGCGLPEFINAVKAGPGWTTRSGFCQMALQTCLNWRTRGLEYPPYIAYLACFVLASGTHVEDVRVYAYYPRLCNILGEPDGTRFPSFDRMHILWEDLEKWTKEDKHEELGRFAFGIRGKMIWVGLPKFQTLISSDERKNLPELFVRADLDPSDPPTPEVMLKLMIYYVDDIFQRGTKKVLLATDGEDVFLREKLVEFVFDELEEWDGSVSDISDEASRVSYNIQSGLRLCIETDSVSKRADVFLRLKTNRQYPEEGLRFSSTEFEGVLFCKEASQGWSKVIRMEDGGRFDALRVNWETGLLLEDKEEKWKARLKAATVRLFISGKNEGFPGWVETQRFERGIPFKIAMCGGEVEIVRTWGRTHCEEFNVLAYKGIPEGWVLFEGRNAKASCSGIEVLTFSSSPRLSLRGGIKVRGGNTYLKIAPPLVALENAGESETVTVNGKPLIRVNDESYLWSLPEDTAVNEILKIEATIAGKELRKILRLEEPKLVEGYRAPCRDVAGQILNNESNDSTTFSGAVAEVKNAAPLTALAFIKPSNRRRIYFLGNIPGQIVEWPLDGIPAWTPVWAVEKTGRKEWKVICCGRALPDSAGGANGDIDCRKVKKWKELVWVKRKITKQPEISCICKKWKEFVEAAKHV